LEDLSDKNMKIHSFTFENITENWCIDKVDFTQLNLLVGASGAGKTSILKALDLICDIAKDKVAIIGDLKWNIVFSHLDKSYRWELESSSDKNHLVESNQSEIVYEKLTSDDGNSKSVLIERTQSESKFENKNLPKLKRTESAISLLSEEDIIKIVKQAFKRFIFNESPQQLNFRLPVNPEHIALPEDSLEIGFQRLLQLSGNLPTVVKAFLLQKYFLEDFEQIKQAYINIFQTVQDIGVGVTKESGSDYRLLFQIKEFGLDDWIPQQNISFGMYRTLACLVEVIAAQEESVIVIDEFENSLGINCISELTDFILDNSPSVQFILTSHHPYIINNIPWKDWQIVSRLGKSIKVTKAIDIPELDTASSLDKFTQLLDYLEQEDAIA
jgi:AAA15 family ATPase/GTPase